MEINQTTILTVVVSLFLISVIVYLLPFILAPVLGPIKLLWGFYVGRRRRRPILLAAYPSSSVSEEAKSTDVTEGAIRAAEPAGATDIDTKILRLIEQEFKYLN